MPLVRTPPPTQVEGLNSGDMPTNPASMASSNPSTAGPAGQNIGQNIDDTDNSSVMLRTFLQSTEELHQKALSTETREQELRDGLRDLITHKGALDAANMASTISKDEFLAAEKCFNQARTAVLHRVRALNPQVKDLIDLVRPDVPIAIGKSPGHGRQSCQHSRSHSQSLGTSLDGSQLSITRALNTSKGLLENQGMPSGFPVHINQIRFAPTNNGLYVAAGTSASSSGFLPIPEVINAIHFVGGYNVDATRIINLSSISIGTILGTACIPSSYSAFSATSSAKLPLHARPPDNKGVGSFSGEFVGVEVNPLHLATLVECDAIAVEQFASNEIHGKVEDSSMKGVCIKSCQTIVEKRARIFESLFNGKVNFQGCSQYGFFPLRKTDRNISDSNPLHFAINYNPGILSTINGTLSHVPASGRAMAKMFYYFVWVCVCGLTSKTMMLWLSKSKLIREKESLGELLQMTVIVSYMILSSAPITISSQISSIAILLTWIRILVGKFAIFGIYIYVCMFTYMTLVMFFALYLMTLFGSAFAFYMLLPKQLAFSSPLLDLVGVFVMKEGQALRELITCKASLNAANMSETISKADYLAYEKKFTQARSAVLQRVRTINTQIKNLTDFVRHDVPLAGEGSQKTGQRSRNISRSRSHSPQLAKPAMYLGQVLSQAALLNTSKGQVSDSGMTASLSHEQIRFALTGSGLYVATGNRDSSLSQFLPIPNTMNPHYNPGGTFCDPVGAGPNGSVVTNVNGLYPSISLRADTQVVGSMDSVEGQGCQLECLLSMEAQYLVGAEDEPSTTEQFSLLAFIVEGETTHGMTYHYVKKGAKMRSMVSWDEHGKCVCTLGILWLTKSDEFQYVYEPTYPARWMLRSLTNLMGKLFDSPFAINPISVTGPVILQAVWTANQGWDKPLPEIQIQKLNRHLPQHLQIRRILVLQQALDSLRDRLSWYFHVDYDTLFRQYPEQEFIILRTFRIPDKPVRPPLRMNILESDFRLSSINSVMTMLEIFIKQLELAFEVTEGMVEKMLADAPSGLQKREFLINMYEEVEKHHFRAEVDRMIKLIINSPYQNKDVFLRELISNASDTLDEIRFLLLTDKEVLSATQDLNMRVGVDKENQRLHIKDTGISIVKADLVNNLWSIAEFGTSEFLSKWQEASIKMEMNDPIHQLRVSFYFSFLITDRVKVTSKYNGDKQHIWESCSIGFRIVEDLRDNSLPRGTTIALELKEKAADYLKFDTMKSLIRKSSEFINFPIYLWASETETVDGPIEDEEVKEEDKKEAEEKKEDKDADVECVKTKEEKPKMEKVEKAVWNRELMNESKPVLKKNKDISRVECEEFYKSLNKEQNPPMTHIYVLAEGEIVFHSLPYIPGFQLSENFKRYGARKDLIKLYVRCVFITDNFEDMMPNYLGFIRGVVDSGNLLLKVSRETPQQNKLLNDIKTKLVRKTLNMIKKIDAEKYPSFWAKYPTNLKLGCMEDQSNHSHLARSPWYSSSTTNKGLTSLEDYKGRIKMQQEHIFHIIGANVEEVITSSFVERSLGKGFEVLRLNKAVNEGTIFTIPEKEGNKFQDTAKEGFNIDGDTAAAEERKEAAKEQFEPCLKWSREDALNHHFLRAEVSKRLDKSLCALTTSRFRWTGNMQGIINPQTDSKTQDMRRDCYLTQKKALGINPRHPFIKELLRHVEDHPSDDITKNMALMTFNTATLRSGYILRNTNSYVLNIKKTRRETLGVDCNEQVEKEEELPEEAPEEEGKDDGEEEESKVETGDLAANTFTGSILRRISKRYSK